MNRGRGARRGGRRGGRRPVRGGAQPVVGDVAKDKIGTIGEFIKDCIAKGFTPSNPSFKKKKVETNEKKEDVVIEGQVKKDKDVVKKDEPVETLVNEKKEEKEEKKYNEQQIKVLFETDALIGEHLDAIESNRSEYLKQFQVLIQNKLAYKLSSAVKGRIFAALINKGINTKGTTKEEIELQDKTKKIIDSLFGLKNLITLADVIKIMEVLDAPRKVRQQLGKLQRMYNRKIEKSNSVKLQTLMKLKTVVHNLLKECDPRTRLNSSQIKVFKKWAAELKMEDLEYMLIKFPPDEWRKFGRLTHSNDKLFNLEYFMPTVFGKPAPNDSVVSAAKNITPQNLAEMLEKFKGDLCKYYSYIATEFAKTNLKIDNKSKQLLAKYAPLEDLIWYFDDIDCKESSQIVGDRLREGEEMKGQRADKLNYGKIMDRLLYFQKKGYELAKHLHGYADEQLVVMKEKFSKFGKYKIIINGDKSGSMSVAVNSATILASLIRTCFGGELSFFDTRLVMPPVQPDNVDDCLEVLKVVKAAGGTTMACHIVDKLKKKEKVDAVIMVSDEGENGKAGGMNLVQAFKKYREVVNPKCKMFFISFLNSYNKNNSLFRQQFDREKLPYKHYVFDLNQPDTSKFNTVLDVIGAHLESDD